MKPTIVLSAVLLAALVPVTPAYATTDVALCSLDFEVSISPGLSPVPGTATFKTDGDSGSVACRSLPGGIQVTGLGRMAAVGVLGLFAGATCQAGVGGGTLSMTIPTADGPAALTNDYTFVWAGPAGQLKGSDYTGTFELTPLEGDCISGPLTRSRIHSAGILAIPEDDRAGWTP